MKKIINMSKRKNAFSTFLPFMNTVLAIKNFFFLKNIETHFLKVIKLKLFVYFVFFLQNVFGVALLTFQKNNFDKARSYVTTSKVDGRAR